MRPILQPQGDGTIGNLLRQALLGDLGQYHTFQAAIAFVRRSGIRHLASPLQSFSAAGGHVRLVVGIDHRGSSFEGLTDLLAAVGATGEVWINHDERVAVTFHPKLYLFEGEASALLIVGSGNLTQGGLYTNDEAATAQELRLDDEADLAVLTQVRAALDAWADSASATVRRLDSAFLDQLVDEQYVLEEAALSPEPEAPTTAQQPPTAQPPAHAGLFGQGAPRRAPRHRAAPPTRAPQPTPLPSPGECQARGFVMTLMRTDVGHGQLTPGTAPRSPEIFVPLAARDACPGFWGWPDAFTEDPDKEGKLDRTGVRVLLDQHIIAVNMMTWPDKSDFRLRSEPLRSAGHIGDLLRLEVAPPDASYDYSAHVIPQGTPEYDQLHPLCANRTRNSRRMWGYYS